MLIIAETGMFQEKQLNSFGHRYLGPLYHQDIGGHGTDNVRLLCFSHQ